MCSNDKWPALMVIGFCGSLPQWFLMLIIFVSCLAEIKYFLFHKIGFVRHSLAGFMSRVQTFIWLVLCRCGRARRATGRLKCWNVGRSTLVRPTSGPSVSRCTSCWPVDCRLTWMRSKHWPWCVEDLTSVPPDRPSLSVCLPASSNCFEDFYITSQRSGHIFSIIPSVGYKPTNPVQTVHTRLTMLYHICDLLRFRSIMTFGWMTVTEYGTGYRSTGDELGANLQMS